MLRRLAPLLALASFAFPAIATIARADGMYCSDNRLVRTGQTAAEVTDACGAPTRTEPRVENICRTLRGRLRCIDTPVEGWLYEAEERLPRMLFFYDGVLVKIAVYYPH